MIGPTQSFQEIIEASDEHGEADEFGSRSRRYLVVIDDGSIPSRAALDAIAEHEASGVGVRFMSQEFGGCYLLLDDKRIARDRWYALARPSEIEYAIRSTVHALHEKYGAGRVWSLSGRVHIVKYDNRVSCADVNGERHVLLRAFFGHENGPMMLDHSQDRASTIVSDE